MRGRVMLRKVLSMALVMVFALVITMPFSVQAANTTYYVDSVNGNDSNSGTSTGTAWKTLSKVNSIIFGAGDKILFKANGIWYGQLMPQGSGTSGNSIIIDMYGTGNKPQIDAQGTTANDGAVVRLYNQQYWEINNLDLKNDAASGEWRCGVLVMAKDYGIANHIYIQNCNIHDIAANFDKAACYTNGVFNPNAVNFNWNLVNWSWANAGGIIFRALKGSQESTAATKFNDILIQGNSVKNVHTLGMGIAMSSDWSAMDAVNKVPYMWGIYTPSTNIRVKNNYTETTGWAGLFLGAVDGSVGNGVIMENNTVNKACAFNDGAALWIAYANNVNIQRNEVYDTPNWNGLDCGAIDLDACTRDNIVQYNYTHGNAGESQLLCNATWDTDTQSTQYVKNNIIRYNLSVNDGKYCRAVALEGVNITSGNPNFIYNNTYYISNVSGSTAKIVEGCDTNTTIKNCIFYNDRTSTDYNTWITFDHNLFYGQHPASEPYDAYKLTSNPLFVNPGAIGYGMSGADAYKLQSGSPCIDSGISISNNGGIDFWGNPVPSGSTDMGAYENPTGSNVVTYNDNDSSLTYAGSGWGYVTNASERYNSDYHSSQTANDKMTFNFSGTDAKVYGTMNGWSGKADVYLDGAYKTTVDTYSATQGFQQLLYDTGTLSSRSHKIDMIVLGQKNTSSTGLWIEVDKFDVMASTPASQTLNDTNSSMTYTGSGWTYNTNSANDYNTDYHSSMTANDKYTFNFNGTSAQIYGHKNGWSGKADVYLDGVYKTTVDSYSATQSYQQLLYDTGTLSSGSHKIEMIVLGQKNTSSTGYWLTVDKVVVTSSSTLVTQTLNDTDSAIVYSGTWGTGTKSACYNGDYHSSTTTNSYFQNTFSGTREKVYMTKNDWCGKVDVYLDGVYQQTIDMYNSTEVCQQMVYDTGDLSAGSHTIKVVVNGQKNASSNGYWVELDKIETISN